MGKKYTAREIEWIQQISKDVMSLNTPVNIDEFGESDEELLVTIADTSPGPEEICCENAKKELINKFISLYLKENEQEVIKLRYGLEDGRAKTLEEVGQIVGKSRERVRQIEARAIRKLRFRFSYNHIRRENL